MHSQDILFPTPRTLFQDLVSCLCYQLIHTLDFPLCRIQNQLLYSISCNISSVMLLYSDTCLEPVNEHLPKPAILTQCDVTKGNDTSQTDRPLEGCCQQGATLQKSNYSTGHRCDFPGFTHASVSTGILRTTRPTCPTRAISTSCLDASTVTLNQKKPHRNQKLTLVNNTIHI